VTTVDFYFNAADRLQVACRLAGKAMAEGKRMLVYAPDAEVAAHVDKLMWTSPATAFLPHCPVDDLLAPDTPILIGRTDVLSVRLDGPVNARIQQAMMALGE
jgi:DNA polymerase-3 subunit chi